MRTILLVGAGHAHLHVVTALKSRLPAGWRVGLVSPSRHAAYSGMLPGVIAGHYRPQEMLIDVARLCAAHDVDFLEDRACGLDRTGRRLLLAGGEPIDYELASLDIGLEADLAALPGADLHAVAVRPIGDFAARIEALLATARGTGEPPRIAVIGGGAGGVEIALALSHRIARETGRRPALTLIEGGKLLADRGPRIATLFRRVLTEHGVALIEHGRAGAVDAAAVQLADGLRVAADMVVLATAGRASSWLAQSGLALQDGFVAVDATLRSLNDAHVFAAGDCAALVETPRAKAGVFAVRAGPPLARNLAAAAKGRALERWTPQARHLALISTGGREAALSYGGLALRAGWLWRVKNRIDRAWVRRFRR